MKTKLKVLVPLGIILSLLGWFAISHGAQYLQLLLAVGGAIGFVTFGNSNQTLGAAAGAFFAVIIAVVFAGFSAGYLVALALLGTAILTAAIIEIARDNC